MTFKLEPVIWSRDTGQQIPYSNRCQLTITWMLDIKDVPAKKRWLHQTVAQMSHHIFLTMMLRYGTFRGEYLFLNKNLFGKGLTQGISGDRGSP